MFLFLDRRRKYCFEPAGLGVRHETFENAFAWNAGMFGMFCNMAVIFFFCEVERNMYTHFFFI